MKLKYIGLKTDGERFLQDQTGIEWMPGSEHDVNSNHAKLFLEHPTIWERAEDQTSLAAAKQPIGTLNPGVPSWALQGIDSGLTDEQLESIAQVGGPETEAGGKLWLDLIGKAFGNTSPPDPVSVIRMPDGMTRILDALDKTELQELAKTLGVKVHPKAGAAKVTEALVAAFPVKA